MIDLTISPALETAFDSPFLTMPCSVHEIRISLQEGSHQYVSEPFELGVMPNYENQLLMGQLQFSYELQKEDPEIILNAADFNSTNGMALISYPKDSQELCHHFAALGRIVMDDVHPHRYWNPSAQIFDGLDVVLTSFAKAAHDALIKVLIDRAEYRLTELSHLPVLPRETYEELIMVHNADSGVRRFEASEILNSADKVIIPESTFNGTSYWFVNQAFANVLGSTGDPEVNGKSWLALWNESTGYKYSSKSGEQNCASLNWFSTGDFECNQPLYGGHIISGKVAKQICYGEDGVVYILPICNAHNNNNNGHMRVQWMYYKSVKLNDYHQ